MGSKRSKSNALDDDERALLKTIAAELRDFAYSDAPMPGWLAAARSEQLRRIADGDVRPILTEALLRERAVALSYKIRRKLWPKVTYKKAQGEVAELYGVTDEFVATRASKHKDYVNAWLAKMPMNIEYNGLSEIEMLRRELASIEDHLPKPSKKR